MEVPGQDAAERGGQLPALLRLGFERGVLGAQHVDLLPKRAHLRVQRGQIALVLRVGGISVIRRHGGPNLCRAQLSTRYGGSGVPVASLESGSGNPRASVSGTTPAQVSSS